MDDEEIRLASIFNPEAMESRDALLRNKRSLVHYTSASNAINILKGEEFWMRNVRSMNDFMEIDHGMNMMQRFFRPPTEEDKNIERHNFYEAINKVHSDIAEETIELFNPHIDSIKYNSYIACLSEHLPQEDELGRLSMWRAYGVSSAKVALIIKPDPFYTETDFLKVFSSPCAYRPEDGFMMLMQRVTKNLNENLDFLKQFDRQKLIDTFASLLILGMLCSKHPGFGEEREWRVLHLPTIYGSEHIPKSVETIDGIPQLVYKLPLKKWTDPDKLDLSPANIIEKIIIGPTAEGLVIYDAIVETLLGIGIKNPLDVVQISNIPLRG